MSPKATTSAAAIPRCSHSSASVLALLTPGAEISSSPPSRLAVECVTSQTPARALAAVASMVSASMSSCRARSLASGTSASSVSGATRHAVPASQRGT